MKDLTTLVRCPKCGEEVPRESMEVCVTCGKTGCHRCLVHMVAGGERTVCYVKCAIPLRGQRVNPFAVANETHCGDCNSVITDTSGRRQDAHFEQGVRCPGCYRKFKEGE